MQSGAAGSATPPRPRVRPIPLDQADDPELLARFVSGRDEDAFAELVRRHGPMVLGVCRRVLRDREAAQDAFQVTFLVLARKAGEVAKPDLLANWLYGVAFRSAMRLRDRSARRQRHERQVAPMPEPEQPPPPDTSEALAVLDEELNYLPEMYRTLLVLCYLEGHTHEEAARRLDCPVGSVSWRMTRAREMLHRRLTRRGVVLPGALLTLLLAAQRARAGAVPDQLAEETTRAAVQYADGAPGAVPEEHAALSDEVLGDVGGRSRWWGYKLLVVLLALLGAGVAAAAVPGRQWIGHPPDPAHVSPGGSTGTGGGCGGHEQPAPPGN